MPPLRRASLSCQIVNSQEKGIRGGLLIGVLSATRGLNRRILPFTFCHRRQSEKERGERQGLIVI